jgi:5-methyltetrahydrofolate--homocysteine methyltransferase
VRKPLFDRLAKAVEGGKTADVVALIEQGLHAGYSAQEMLYDGLIRGMTDIGIRFKNHDVFVPEVLIAARTLKKGTDTLKSALIDEGVEPVGKAIVATVAGDLHDIGKNLVRMMLEGAGFRVIDLGVDVTAEAICEAVKAHEPDVLALSALLNTTLNQLMGVISYLEENGVRDRVIIMVGGAPVDEKFAKKIGADAYAPDAVTAAETARKLLRNGERCRKEPKRTNKG